MKRKLPKRIKIGKRKYDVRSKLTGRKLGTINYKERVIHVSTHDFRLEKLTESERHETFWHEVTHGILHDMGHELRDNERFVIAFSRRLNGVIESAEFE